MSVTTALGRALYARLNARLVSLSAALVGSSGAGDVGLETAQHLERGRAEEHQVGLLDPFEVVTIECGVHVSASGLPPGPSNLPSMDMMLVTMTERIGCLLQAC